MSPRAGNALRRFWHNRQGGTAIEFAIVAPIFLFCAFALIQVGYGIYAQSTISQLAEKGARHLLFASSDIAGAEQTILSGIAATPLNPDQLTVTTQRLATPYPHLELTLDYALVAIGLPLPQDFNLRSTVMVPVAQ